MLHEIWAVVAVARRLIVCRRKARVQCLFRLLQGPTYDRLSAQPRKTAEPPAVPIDLREHARPELAELIGLLNLVPGQRHYEIVVTERGTPDPARFPIPPSAELRVDARSTAQVLFFLANGVEVPPDHLCAGLVPPMVDADGQVLDSREVTRGLFEVHLGYGHKPPRTAFVASKYRGYWYYIDDRDQASKATFALMMQLSRLDFARARPGAPLLTLPVGR